MRLLGGKRKKSAQPKKAGASGAFLAGRGIAIAVLAVVSGACFALGFFVGQVTTEGEVVTEVITVSAESHDVPVQYGTGLPVAGETGGASLMSTPSTESKELPETKKSQISKETQAGKQAAGTGKTFTVQVGAFARDADAREMSTRFRQKGYPAYVLESKTSENKTIYRVRVGRYNNKSDAKRMALKLKRHEGATSFIIAAN